MLQEAMSINVKEVKIKFVFQNHIHDFLHFKWLPFDPKLCGIQTVCDTEVIQYLCVSQNVKQAFLEKIFL